jgi:rubredoxin
MGAWICENCGFVYEPEIGDPDGGIPPGTAFGGHPRFLVLPGLRRAQERLCPL